MQYIWNVHFAQKQKIQIRLLSKIGDEVLKCGGAYCSHLKRI